MGGFAWTFDQVTQSQDVAPAVGGFAQAGTLETAWLWRPGWVAGVGVEVAITGNWTAKAEFLETVFGHKGAFFAASADTFSSSLAMQSVRFGLNYRLDAADPAQELFTKGPSALEWDRFAFHAQATFLNQATPTFRNPFFGPNSLIPNQGRETSDVTLYAGMKLWQGAEVWVNPEIDQGFGLAGPLGVAGFTSGKAYKVGADYPYARLHRAFFRQTIDLGVMPRAFRLASISSRERKRRIGWSSRSENSACPISSTLPLRPRSARRFHELVAGRHRNVRLRGRCLGLY